MYTDYFGLREAPFSITPDPRYVYMSLRHQEALAHLLYGTGEEGGFVQLTGEVGTGKTTLVRVLLEQELGETDVALIINPRLTLLEFVATICDELGAGYPTDATTLKPLVDALNRHLLRSHAKGRQTVVIVDEAQNLVPDVLEQVRLLTNLETAKHKLLRIILVGQPELKDVLDRYDMRQLAQRITARCHLNPLSREEVAAYVAHRLEVAGGRRDIFSPAALRMVHRQSGGIPRLINVVCDRALLGAYTESARQVDAPTVKQAAAEAFGEPRSRFREWLNWRSALAGAASAVLVAGGIAAIPAVHERWLAALGSTEDSPPPVASAKGSASVTSPQPDVDDETSPDRVSAPDILEDEAPAAAANSGIDASAGKASVGDQAIIEPEVGEDAYAVSLGTTEPAQQAPEPSAIPRMADETPDTAASPDEPDGPIVAEPLPFPAPQPRPAVPVPVPDTEASAVVDLRGLTASATTPPGSPETGVPGGGPGRAAEDVVDLRGAGAETDTEIDEVVDLRGLSQSTVQRPSDEVIDLRGESASERPPAGAPVATLGPVLRFEELAEAVAGMRVPDAAMFQRLFALWNVRPAGTTGANPCIEAYGLGMRCLEGEGAWHNLRTWNRPALIWLQAGEERAQPALLSALEAGLAVVDLGNGPRAVGVQELEVFWTGRLALVWKLQADVALVGLGSTGEPVRWLHERLNLAEGLPASAGTAPSVFDQTMRERVINYQRAHRLAADGIVGQYTMIQLNNLVPVAGTPTLVR